MEHSKFNMKLIFLNLILFCSHNVYGGSNEMCTPLNGVDRTCMPFQECPQDIRDMIAMKNKPAHVMKQLRDAVCGEMKLKKLCCPTPKCYTWDGRPGVCVKYNNESASLFPEDMTYRQLKFSMCPKISRFGTELCFSELPPRQTGDCETDKSAFPPDPGYGCCGQERVAYNKIIGGSTTKIDQYPWLAVLKYPDGKGECTGVLISGKYVLTAAHCVASTDQPYAVVLGEYDKRTDIDCDATGDCNEGAVTVAIEGIKVHRNFKMDTTPWRDDIALIRLQQMVNYSDFILPICLPIAFRDETSMPDVDFKLMTAGWRNSDVKRASYLPFVSRRECLTSYPNLMRKQMCAGGVPNRASCVGDSGSPLMNERIGTFEILGISSYSHGKCGNDSIPDIYTKVYNYVNWIHINIRP